MKKNKQKEFVCLYEGSRKFTFINATIFQCIKFWLITKLTGGDKPMDDIKKYIDRT